MKAFEDYFSDQAIIQELSKLRSRMAKKRNDVLFLHRISHEQPRPKERHLLDVFPPRRQWHKFRPRNRGRRPSVELNQTALLRATLRLRQIHFEASWAQNLERTIRTIRDRALGADAFVFAKPKIIPQEKERGKAEFRPIATFDAQDKIIDCITARYFREHLDCALDDACMAFRCAYPGTPAPQFHDAVETILNLQRRHTKTGLVVGECDIMGFFDCVDHDVAVESLERLIEDSRRKYPSLEIHPRAVEIFRAYLAVYSFPENVRKQAQMRLRKQRKDAYFKWPLDALRQFHVDPEAKRIGVPQGGALSCLIANCVLHEADKVLRVARRKSARAFTYLRYCDDMIILSADKPTCLSAFRKYQRALKRLLLPAHAAKSFRKYDVGFWNGKSKNPYHWKKPTPAGGIPWIQFVGYQVRYDGLVRVRKKSVQKHLRKLTALADELFAQTNPDKRRKGCTPAFSPKVTKRKKQIVHRFRQKLLSLSVGRQKHGMCRDAPLPMCWVSGYRGLFTKRQNSRGAVQTKKVVKTMLKALDRHRERQIQRVKRRMSKLPDPHKKQGADTGGPKYYGSPFSYHGQLPNSGRKATGRRSPQ